MIGPDGPIACCGSDDNDRDLWLKAFATPSDTFGSENPVRDKLVRAANSSSSMLKSQGSFAASSSPEARSRLSAIKAHWESEKDEEDDISPSLPPHESPPQLPPPPPLSLPPPPLPPPPQSPPPPTVSDASSGRGAGRLAGRALFREVGRAVVDAVRESIVHDQEGRVVGVQGDVLRASVSNYEENKTRAGERAREILEASISF